MIVRYNSNNSGGSWWLDDGDWIKLEKAGWTVEWGGKAFCHNNWDPQIPPICANKQECNGHIRFKNAKESESKRWLDSLAMAASKEFPSMRDAIMEWEKVVSQDASDEGCNCCGAPHSFSTDSPKWDSVSGKEILRVLYPKTGPLSLRDAYRQLSDDD